MQIDNLDNFSPEQLNHWEHVFVALARYCRLKLKAQEYRKGHYIVRAMAVDHDCDVIYDELPQEAKWEVL